MKKSSLVFNLSLVLGLVLLGGGAVALAVDPDTGSGEVKVILGGVLTLNVTGENASMNFAAAGAEIATSSLIVTNNVGGYTLSVEMAPGDSSPGIPGQNYSNDPGSHGEFLLSAIDATDGIAPITGTTALTDDTWGFSTTTVLATGVFSKVPYGTPVVLNSSEETGVKITTITYGVQISNSLPSGTYLNYVVYTASPTI
jgi:hypothetical protein